MANVIQAYQFFHNFAGILYWKAFLIQNNATNFVFLVFKAEEILSIFLLSRTGNSYPLVQCMQDQVQKNLNASDLGSQNVELLC